MPIIMIYIIHTTFIVKSYSSQYFQKQVSIDHFLRYIDIFYLIDIAIKKGWAKFQLAFLDY